MDVVPKIALAVLLLGSIGLAWMGPPPRRHVDVRLRGAVLLTGLAGYAAAATALVGGALVAGTVVLALAGELVCVAGWLSRGPEPGSDDDGDGGGGGGGGRRPKPPGPDWDAFELAFRRYARERERQGV